jgi:2-polyprenyl-3-methyl-5-hydroxy-6-metoxy-1,4-benzoquinol methylase
MSGARNRSHRSFGQALLEKTFLFLRKFKPARERVTLGEFNDYVEREHVARYRFAQRFCKGKTVADIACGTGYGTKILAEVAQSVVGYDKISLCGNRLIDLEKQCWDGTYDVIVSFETLEHLENPEFFLENARKTSKLLVVSSPIGEFRGYNPHHKQVWTFPEFKEFLEKTFHCDYYYQSGEEIRDEPAGPIRFVIAACTLKPNPA